MCTSVEDDPTSIENARREMLEKEFGIDSTPAVNVMTRSKMD